MKQHWHCPDVCPSCEQFQQCVQLAARCCTEPQTQHAEDIVMIGIGSAATTRVVARAMLDNVNGYKLMQAKPAIKQIHKSKHNASSHEAQSRHSQKHDAVNKDRGTDSEAAIAWEAINVHHQQEGNGSKPVTK